MTVRPEEFDHLYTEAAAKVAARHGQPRTASSAALAVLLIPPGPSAGVWRDICATYCNDHRYSVVAIASTLAAVMAVVAAGEATVVIVGQREHLPTDEPVRIEFVNERAQDLPVGRRRPVRRR